MLRPSSSSMRFSAGWTRFAATGMKASFILLRMGSIGNSISARVRQMTATQGLEGTKWKVGVLEMTVMRSSKQAFSRISNAMGIPPIPAPKITMWAIFLSPEGCDCMVNLFFIRQLMRIAIRIASPLKKASLRGLAASRLTWLFHSRCPDRQSDIKVNVRKPAISRWHGADGQYGRASQAMRTQASGWPCTRPEMAKPMSHSSQMQKNAPTMQKTLSKLSSVCPLWVYRMLPYLRWWPSVNGSTTRDDAMAGLTGALIVLPQGVAFATIAGMPPEYGLYAAMMPAIIAALFGSSWQLVSGPTTAISIAVFASVSPFAHPGTPEFISLVLTLSLIPI